MKYPLKLIHATIMIAHQPQFFTPMKTNPQSNHRVASLRVFPNPDSEGDVQNLPKLVSLSIKPLVRGLLQYSATFMYLLI